ncbi:discoidin domain-containing protein [Puniceicoccaceae bacterium K14]|nr:discoidin domain-containing protein [Puniceicoccaceae bacterium K14]
MKHLQSLKRLCFAFALTLLSFQSLHAQFVHPGITHKKSDLDRIKYMVEAQIDPWYSSYQEMVADSKSSYNYTVQGSSSFTELGRDSGVNYSEWNSDIRAAYYNAIRWYVTGDSRHADKAVEIFNAWSNLTSVTSGGTNALSGGVAYIMIEAAEIIKSTYSGWSNSDINDFKDMLVYPGYSTTSVPSGNTSFYWMSYEGDPVRHGNQGLSGWRAIMAMGIFLDNEIMYERSLRYIQGLPHRSDDLPYPSGPNTSVSLVASNDYADTYSISRGSSIPDYGYNELLTNYIWENGQCQESSRDQQHVFFGMGLLCSMAEMAWNQGDDLYSFANDRLLLGLEYNMRYNVSYLQSYPDQTSHWVPTVASGEFLERFDRTGRWYSKAISPIAVGDFSDVRPVFEMPLAHYLGRGFKSASEVTWTQRARDKAIELSGYEVHGWSNDAIGWGALTARRPDGCYGDPISGFDSNGLPIYEMNVLPMTIQAENFDYSPVSGEDRIYNDTTSGNTGSQYRTDENVDIQAADDNGTDIGWNVGWIANGEYLNYTVYVPSDGDYDISIRYAANSGNGVIKVSFDGVDKTGNVSLPTTNDWQNWEEIDLSSSVSLSKGVQPMKVDMVNGGFNLHSITITQSAGSGNLALNRNATQSSTSFGGVASRAVDGDTNGIYNQNSVTHTSSEANPWWEVDLGSSSNIGDINIYNRTDSCCESRLTFFTVNVLDSNRNSTFTQSFTSYPDPSITVNAGGANGRYVRIELDDTNPLSLAEVEVFSGTASVTNLAENQPVTVSGEQAANPGSNAVDNNTNTRWSVSGFPQWLEVDLGSVRNISSTELVCFSDRAYQFVVESKTSAGGSYTQIVDRSSNTTPGSTASPIKDTFTPVNARYVRITVQGASGYSGSWCSQLEFRVLGN